MHESIIKLQRNFLSCFDMSLKYIGLYKQKAHACPIYYHCLSQIVFLFCFLLAIFFYIYLIYNVVLVLVVQQSNSYIYIYMFFFRFFPLIGYYTILYSKMLSIVPCAI